MMKSGVYQIYNPINEKRYIGSSIDIVRRLKEHRRCLIGGYHHNQHLQNAWNKYGDCFEFKPLEYCEPDKLLELEQQYIDYYNSADRKFGYNIDERADHAGYHLSDETRKKIGDAHRGRKRPQDVIEKCRLAQLGVPKPKQSETMKLKYANGETTFPRFNEVSEEKQKEWSKHASEAGKRRYSNYANRPKGFFIKVQHEDVTLYFPSLREAARQLHVDKGGIKYALDNTNGYMKKLNIYFSYISEEDFIQTDFYKQHYKTTGEK